MPCYHPLEAWQFGTRIFFKNPGPLSKHIKLPCGRCIGCKLERSRQWAVRLMHEAQLHKKTSFITLTYNDKSLKGAAASSQSLTAAAPRPGLPQPLDRTSTRETHAHEKQERAATLSKRDLQLFTKRLHDNVKRQPESTKGVRYFACGEYGEKTHRPHYHLAVFGEDFSGDRLPWRTAGKYQVWRSPRLEELWPFGHSEIGELTFESAAYVARYLTKKITGEKAIEHYKRTDEHGCEYWLEPEFSHMSRNPGLGQGWLKQYKTSVYPHDRVIINARAAKPPRYYDQELKKTDLVVHDQVKAARKAAINSEANSPERLRAGETITRAKLKQKPRSLE